MRQAKLEPLKRIEFDAEDMAYNDGVEIFVRGFRHDPTMDDSHGTQLYLEVEDGELNIYVWDGSSEDPVKHVIHPANPIVAKINALVSALDDAEAHICGGHDQDHIALSNEHWGALHAAVEDLKKESKP